jgi:hypothetical protein
MKKLAAALIFFLLTTALSSFTTVKAEPSRIPHEDPDAAESTIDAYSLLTEYAGIFALAASKQYENASQLSEQLSHITLPSNLKYILDKYNQMTQQIISTLNDLQDALDTASILLDQNRLAEAGQVLDRAGVLVSQAQILLDDLKDATKVLSDRFGVWAAPAASKVRQAYNQLEEMLQRLNELIDQYHQLLQQTQQRATDISDQKLSGTSLTLNLNATECFVGGTVIASGTLTANGRGVGGQEVKLFLDNNQTATAKTDSNGEYSTAIKIPYIYVDSVSVKAKYTPEGNSKNAYLAASSPTVTLRLLFYRTIIELSIPEEANPGLPVLLNGNVTSDKGPSLNPRQVQIQLDDINESAVETDEMGRFTAEFTIDANMEVGNHNLTVTVDPKEIYAGTIQQFTLNIQKKTTELVVEAPTFVLLPNQIQVSGTANTQQGPLNNANIQVEFLNISSYTQTDANGAFNLTLDLPLNTVLGGYQTLDVEVQPDEPWQATEQNQTNVFTLNVLSIGIALASSLAVSTVAYLKLSKTKQSKQQTQVIEQISPVPEKAPTPAPEILTPASFEGVRGQILKAYLEGQKAVQQTTKLALEAHMTLREYATLTTTKIMEVAARFFELTILAEKSLYSAHEPQPEDVEKATDLVNHIRRELAAGS